MKKTKLGILIAVILLIGVLVTIAIRSIGDPPIDPPSSNAFVGRIELQIDSIRRYPTTLFCTQLFTSALSQLDKCKEKDYLGTTKEENEIQYNRLRNDLCAAYTAKFVDQANIVINGTDWKPVDLALIRNELSNLVKLNAFDMYSLISNEVWKIKSQVSDYFEVQYFIGKCKSYSFPNQTDIINTVNAPEFFVSEYDDVFSKAVTSPLSNCPYLLSDLESAQLSLFTKHNFALEMKINRLAGSANYGCCYNHKEWTDLIYNPLTQEIDYLSNNNYKLPYALVDSQIQNLYGLLSTLNSNAFEFVW
jgi:hypothetical protein